MNFEDVKNMNKIDLEDVEKWVLEIYKDLEPFFDLVEKNKKILDKYCKRKDKEDE